MATNQVHTNSSNMVTYRCENIEKSTEDKRDYRGIQLKNRLKVLLVSDPTTDKSAAAMDVNIGFLSDPDNLPGLAHFCEHMLFLGTEKYPEVNTYNKFLTEHGGESNASTSSDYTCYFFDVIPDHLSPALDIFAQFFISPLFSAQMTEQELQAINSEYDKNVCNDYWRLDQLNRLVADQNHPHSKFGSGNKQTLQVIPKSNNINVHDELLNFHKQWYSSNIMSLVIFGKESLDDLEKMAIEHFSGIKDCNVELPTWKSPYSEDYQGLKTFIVPIKDIRNLHMSFPVPDTRKYYQSAPLHYISHLLGHEGPGSLLSLLKAKGWCNSLTSGVQHGGRGFGLFNVNVELTNIGIDHTDDVIELVFQYINLLKSDDIKKWIFDELSNILATSFRFKDKEEPRSFVTNIVHDLQQYPMEQVLTAHFLLTEWNPELIKELLSLLKPECIRLAIIGKNFESLCEQTEKWYGTKYHLEKISDELIIRWKNSGLSDKLALPPPNTFLPDSFDLYSPDPDSKEFPSIILDTPLMRVWYKQDDEYFLPKLNCFFDFVSPIVYSDPLNCSLNTVFVLLFQDELNEYAYAAELAGINYQFRNTLNGLSIRFDGYDSKQHVLLECFIDKLVSFKVNPERFAILKEIYVRGLRNFEAQQPYQHSTFYLGMMLAEQAWSKKEFLQASEVMTVENLQDYIGQLLMRIHVECLIHGNASKKKAMEFASIVQNKLPKNIIPLLPQQLILMREIQLEKGSHYRLEVDHTVHRSSCTLLYYQCGLESTELNVLLELFVQIISEPCFNILRTKEQLGYIVFSGIRRTNGVQGVRILVQSDRHPSYLESRIEAFLQHMDTTIENLSEEEFENHREALIAEKLKRPKMLLSRSYLLRLEITTQQYHFDRVNVEVNALKQVTKKQLMEFFRDTISVTSPNRQKLAVHVISSAEGGVAHPSNLDRSPDVNEIVQVDLFPVPEELKMAVKIEDMVTFKSGRALFPLITPYTNVSRKGAHCKL